MVTQIKELVATNVASVVTLAIFAASPPAFAEDLLVSTAISLKEALFDIGKKFEKENAGVHVVLNAGSSGELASQIKNGAPVDIFVSANDLEIKLLAGQHLLDGSALTLAYNRLAIVTPKSSPVLKKFADVANCEKIAIGNPETVPAGRYAEQALRSAKLLDRLKERHAFIYGQNARALVTYVEQENVNAAFVYLTDSLVSTKMSTALVVPRELTDPIRYEIVRISKSEHPELADRFIKFALSDSSKGDLVKHHFEKTWN